MEEVQQQLMLPTIRSYLKPYTTMPLAGFMEDVTSWLKDVSPTEMITGLKSAAKKAEPEVQWVGVNGDLITRRGIEQEQEPARS